MKTLKLLAIFFAIPIICFFSLGSALDDQQRVWNAEVHKRVTTERAQEFELPGLCESAPASNVDVSPICDPFRNTLAFRTFSAALGLATLLFVGIVFLAGVASASNRQVLLRAFRPGLVVTNIVVAVLLIAQAMLLSGTIFYAASNGRADDNFVFYSILFGLAAAAGAFFALKPLFRSRKAQAVVIGHSLNPTDCPALWGFVKDLAQRTGSDAPHNLVVGLTPEFFVTEAEVQCIDAKVTGRTMYLSLPVCRILTVEELSAIVAHELGHFKGEDTAFSLHFYPIYKGAVDSVNGVAQTAGHIVRYANYIPIWGFQLVGWIASLTLYPSVYMLAFFLDAFAKAENKISRDRELAADAVAAQTAGAVQISTALVKVVAFTGVWHNVMSWMSNSLAAGHVEIEGKHYDPREFFANLSEMYASVVLHGAPHADLSELDTITIPHPTDSHPPLSVRLSALGLRLADITEQAVQVAPTNASHELIDNWQHLEAQLSSVAQKNYRPAITK